MALSTFRTTRVWGPFLEGSERFKAPGKPWQILEPYDFRAVLFTYSQYEERFPAYKMQEVSGG